ncbi:hypothetical protein KUV44_01305 [Marinobacter daepoensis]|uniref:Uncharacterized protein n=1 Tax=Marinobacter daepoensis TaxID=262077 RepID=A0ABS3BBE3_9GAMM|nr:hypothetical protein [Marinobacter daepoensis]MBN7769082.1 hypothetical protein [Marinobacter daepoensis]MBY6077772.1 hypothetical protein [Marinobacter daepoensis]
MRHELESTNARFPGLIQTLAESSIFAFCRHSRFASQAMFAFAKRKAICPAAKTGAGKYRQTSSHAIDT